MDEDKILNVLFEIAARAQGRATGFAIGNTSDTFENQDCYLTPLRQTSELVYAGVIVKNVAMAETIAALVDGRVEYVFVDAEKKIQKKYYGPNDAGNIERAVREKVKKSSVMTYKGNDLAVEAVDLLLGQLMINLGRMQVGIVGAGNLGSKIALKLVERGAHVRVFRRDASRLERIVEGLNAIKSDNILSSVAQCNTLEETCAGADIIVACANEKGIVSPSLVASMNSHGPHVLIDAGKGCFSDGVVGEGMYTIYRVDVANVQRAFFEAAIKTQAMFKSMGRKVLPEENLTVISPGILGKWGEVVVDNIEVPSMILGVADGKGSFLQDTRSFDEKLNALKNNIQKQGAKMDLLL